jgi:hypothetical protein
MPLKEGGANANGVPAPCRRDGELRAVRSVAASVLPAVLPTAFPWARSLPEEHLKAFAGELRETIIADSPKRVETVLFDWQGVAEVRAGERTT